MEMIMEYLTMDINSLNPQTILYNTDSSIEKYFLATVNNAKLEQSSGIISEMNKNCLA